MTAARRLILAPRPNPLEPILRVVHRDPDALAELVIDRATARLAADGYRFRLARMCL